MDLVPPAQKNVVRIRTFKDDVLRAQGPQVPSEPPTKENKQEKKLAPQDTRPIIKNSLSEKNYTPLPAPQQTSAPLPKGIRPVVPAQLRETHNLGGESVRVAKPVQSQVQQSLHDTLSQSDIAQISQTQKASILSDEGRLHSGQSLDEGTIVRDTKRKRFKFFPALKKAVAVWFTDTKKEYQKVVRGPVHTVAKAESRLETIRKAIEQSRQAPQDDFSQVAETLKTTQRPERKTAVIIKEKSEMPAPTWSSAQDEPETVTAVEVEARAPILPETDVDDAADSVEQEPVFETQPIELQPEEVYVTPEPQVQYIKEVIEIPEVETQTYVQEPPRQYAPARTPSEKPFYIALASIVFVATMLGVGVSYYFFGKTDTGAIVKNEVTYEAPNLFTANNTQNFVLPEDRLTLLSVLSSGVEENGEGVVHLYPTLGGEGIPADIDSILGTLGLRADGSFIRGVREIAFGGSYGEAFIVLTTASFDTAFAGMLGWEEAMSSDLSPLFGTPVSSSYNPEVRTDTQTSSAYFKDVIASNKNARLLVDENGEDRIVYTFIDQNTIVITTNRESLSDIIPLLK
jgi:hypothetical protein